MTRSVLKNLPRDANGNVVPNIRENLPIYVRNGQELLSRNYERASLKWQLSPRLGVAFTIAETSVLRFFFGQVFQIPNFEFLYRNPFFRRDPAASVSGPFGNADLKPQRTIKGELGLQQQFGEDISVDVALYFNDIRDLNGSAFIREYFDRGAYTQFVNTDYALTRGLTIRIDKRFSQLFNFGVDYTFQVAQGNASDPAAAAFALAANAPLPTTLVPLDWNQTHTLNLTGNFDIDGWMLSAIARFGSGFPYTPDLNAPFPILVRGSRGEIVTNSLTRPATFTLDVRAQKTFTLDKSKLSLYVQVYNLLDFSNQSGNYPFALLTPDLIFQNTRVRSSVNTPEEYQRRPQLFAPPRQVLVGVSFAL
ncbi:MAG: TonB-dependent receptor [Chloroherpetonaceae bacterium]|nr:TonB-dependent receptor [Chloroherpetonaceae bacterium]